jgi:hypothetical protein
MSVMAFRFETANERWKSYKQSMDWERDDNGNAVTPSNWALGFPDDVGEYEFPQQSMENIKQRLHEGATMEEIKQEFAKFIAENNLTDNDLYEIGIN